MSSGALGMPSGAQSTLFLAASASIERSSGLYQGRELKHRRNRGEGARVLLETGGMTGGGMSACLGAMITRRWAHGGHFILIFMG